MLQSMTAHINGLSSRIDTMEKKSAVAEVAVIGGVDPKGNAQRSGRSLKREEQASSRRETYDEMAASLGTMGATKISALISRRSGRSLGK